MNRRFLQSLHEEHLEEISSMYERRIGLLDDVEIDHEDLADLEARIEGHLDALVVGADPALELCAERALEGDAGELFGALCVFFRQGRQDLFEAALARFEEEDDDDDPSPDADEDDEPPIDALVATAKAELGVESPEDDEDEPAPDDDEDDDDYDEDESEDDDDTPTLAQALGDALSVEGPVAWQPLFERLLEQGNPPVVTAIARMMAVRGLRVGPKVVAAAEQQQRGAPLTMALWALGRARERSSSALLTRWAQQLEGDEAEAATLALLRFGDPSILDFVLRTVPTHPWAVSLLAIAGGPWAAPTIQARLERAELAAEDILAAGLFGEPAMVPRLLDLLESASETAAQALYLVTGAPVFETVLETVEGADPLETLPNGEPDPRNQVEVNRLAHDPSLWRQWWNDHGKALTKGRRYRLGQPASPEVLAQTLRHFVLRRPVRQLAAEEIGLRYCPQRDLDVDQWAGPQRAAFAGLSSLRQSNVVIARADGAWVFAQALQR